MVMHLLGVNRLRLQTVEVGDAEDGRDVGVELLLGRLVVVTLAWKR